LYLLPQFDKFDKKKGLEAEILALKAEKDKFGNIFRAIMRIINF
jgi:hypothetical protein